MELVAIGILGVVFLLTQVVQLKERKDLLNRIMAKDYQEYASWKTEEQRVKIDQKREDRSYAV